MCGRSTISVRDVERVGDDRQRRDAPRSRRGPGGRPACRAVSEVVVPPLKPTTWPGRDHARRPRRRSAPSRRRRAAAVAHRQVVGDRRGHHAAVGAGDQLLVGERREVAADRRLGDAERGGRLGHREPAALGEQVEQRAGAPGLVGALRPRPTPSLGRSRSLHTTRRQSGDQPALDEREQDDHGHDADDRDAEDVLPRRGRTGRRTWSAPPTAAGSRRWSG